MELADEVDDVLVAELGGRDERDVAGDARELGNGDVVFGLRACGENRVELDQGDEERRGDVQERMAGNIFTKSSSKVLSR